MGLTDRVRARNESAWLLPNDGTRTNHGLRRDMRQFADSDEIDLVIVGCGAGGSVLLQRLARAGWRVAALDAGPFWDPDTDWVSDEAGSHGLYWTDPRVIAGSDPVPMGSNNSGRGVGGSMVHYAGYTPRFHPSDFMTYRLDGVGADWPLNYPELKPYYEDIEQELPVAGDHWPWGDPHRYPHRPHPVGGNGEMFLRGADKLGITAKVGPVAITNGRFGNRPHCVYRGFCLQGCKVNAKASPLITHIPDALARGAEVRADAMVTQVAIDKQTGRAMGVHYVRDGRERFQRAKMVAIAGYSIETPRLLLNSASSRFPDGLCNEFDQVGRYLMVQGAPQTAGRFDAEVRMYKAPPPEVSTEQFYETDPAKDYKRGFSIQTVSPLPITWAEHVAAQGHWGAALREYMSDYVHWSCLGALCEFLPWPQNRVTLAEEKDSHGLPVARFSYSRCDNDRALARAAQGVMENILRAAGADEVITIQRFAHLVGGARMAATERDGVVDKYCRTFAVPNLYITDGSVLPTQGSANPALTIMAVAARAADQLIARKDLYMAPTVADYLLERLRSWDVKHVFAYAGDGINGILAAWGRAANKPQFIQARHEEMAAFEAVGYAKFTGHVGVCMATSGPGAIHLLNGLYDAKLDHVPVVAIVGQTNRSAMGGSYQQEVDLLSLFKDVASEYVQMVTVPEQLPNVLDRAIRTAIAERAPTAIIIPADVQELEYSAPTHAFKMVPSSLGVEWPVTSPADEAIIKAAEVLNAGSKVAILAGQGARGARHELEQVAELLGAGVAKPLLGKDVLSDELPYVTGSIGLLGTRPSYEMMMNCDTLLTVGSSFPYTQFLPKFDQARGVQIDIDGKFIGMRYPNEVNLVGDAATTLRALIPHLTRIQDRSWREGIEAGVDRWWRSMDAEAEVEADPVNPMLLFRELSGRLPMNAIVTADSGSSANWYARQLKFRGDIRGSLSGNLATMGPGVPYGIGAKFGHPDRPVIVFAGDGAMQMNGLAELITIKHYWQEWADPRLIVAVLHNNDLNQVTWEMRAMEGAPKFTASQQLPDISYEGFARSLGLNAIAVDKPDQVGAAWDQALAADRPTVLDVRTDPSIPPIPPHATFEQAKNAATALLKGDPNGWSVLKEGLMTKAREILPGKTN